MSFKAMLSYFLVSSLMLSLIIIQLSIWWNHYGTWVHQLAQGPDPVCLDPDTGIARQSLHNLLMEHGSDKEWHHGYSRYFAPVLEPLRDQNIRFVEIGVETGASMAAWLKYFSNPEHIYGIGYDTGDGLNNWQEEGVSKCSGPSISSHITSCSLFKGDQGNQDFLSFFKETTGGNFHVVIDDGSHLPSHQLISFESLWPSVVTGGLYIVEDVETSYWKKEAELYGYKYDNQKSFVEHMKLVADVINREYAGNSPLPVLYNDISYIQFGQNVIIVRKHTEEETKFIGRTYRFSGNSRGTGPPLS